MKLFQNISIFIYKLHIFNMQHILILTTGITCVMTYMINKNITKLFNTMEQSKINNIIQKTEELNKKIDKILYKT